MFVRPETTHIILCKCIYVHMYVSNVILTFSIFTKVIPFKNTFFCFVYMCYPISWISIGLTVNVVSFISSIEQFLFSR